MSAQFPDLRLRRLRRTPGLRRLVAETALSLDDLVLPLFITARAQGQDIASMPGVRQWSLAELATEIAQIQRLNIPAVMLFGIPSHKDANGSSAFADDGIVQQATRLIKQQAPSLIVIADLCCCEYTDHGHCGPLDQHVPHVDVDNDATLPLLAQQAVSMAKAGVDMVAPSGMMDGMVQAIRHGLDQAKFTHIPILSYAAKYASSFYGPFRDAAESGMQAGDRRGYQMNPANGNEALREVALDVAEGADLLMVKPAGPYLDVIRRVKDAHPHIPLAAYQVSGEYAMIKTAGQQGLVDEQAVMLESLLGIKRAGADIIITYFAKTVAEYLASFGCDKDLFI